MHAPFNPTLKTISSQQFEVEISHAWYQGKGAYGGLIFAYFVMAFERFCALPIRSLHVELCQAAKEGTYRIDITQTRKGLRTEFLYATLSTERGIQATASAVMGLPRDSNFDGTNLAYPTARTYEKSPVLPKNPMMPDFCQNLVYKPSFGPLPFTRARHQPIGVWVEFEEMQCSSSAAVLAALIDAGWPSILIHLPRPKAMGTVSIQIHFFSYSPPPFLLCSQTLNATAGHVTETNALWNADGDLLAHAQQLIALY